MLLTIILIILAALIITALIFWFIGKLGRFLRLSIWKRMGEVRMLAHGQAAR